MVFTSKDLQPADNPTPAKAKEKQRKIVGLVRSCEDWIVKNVEYQVEKNMKLIFTKRGLRKKITNKTNGEVYFHDISVCNTNLLWRVSVLCF